MTGVLLEEEIRTQAHVGGRWEETQTGDASASQGEGPGTDPSLTSSEGNNPADT